MVRGFSVKEVPPFVDSAQLILKPFKLTKPSKTFEIMTNAINESYVEYWLKNSNTGVYQKAVLSGGVYKVNFPTAGSDVTIKAILRSNSTRSITPVIKDIFVKAIDTTPYHSPGMIKSKNITVVNSSDKLILELQDANTELINVQLKVGTTTITGVYKTLEELQAMDMGVGGSTTSSYYLFTVPSSFQGTQFTGMLEFTLNPGDSGTVSPTISRYLLYSFIDGYIDRGSFTATTPDLTPYTFDKVRVNVNQTEPTGTDIKYKMYGQSLTPGFIKALSQDVSQFQMSGYLSTTDKAITPGIQSLTITAVGETPFIKDLDSVSDLEEESPPDDETPPDTGNPPDLGNPPKEDPIIIDDPDPINMGVSIMSSSIIYKSTDRLEGNYSIGINHVGSGRTSWSYTVEDTPTFDATKLSQVQIWVKPFTELSSISFSFYDEKDRRDEIIANDADGDGQFEVYEDMVLDEWNLLTLDLSKTSSDTVGIDKDASTCKIKINNDQQMF